MGGCGAQPPHDHACVTSTRTEAAAAVRIGAGLAQRKRAELLELLRPCFARPEPWLQAGKYAAAVMSELPERNGWSIARHAGTRRRTRPSGGRIHAVWDTFAAMGVVRRFAVAGLDDAARRRRRRRGLVIGAIDETGQEKAGEATCGVKRQYLGCAGQVANGINTVHVAYVRERTGHALIGARQWIPREQIEDPVKSLLMGLPPDLGFRTKGQLAIDISTDAAADGIRPDFYCGDEVYGHCTGLREHFEAERQAYVLRVPSNFMLTLAAGTKMTCADAVQALLKHPRRWEVRSAGGSKGQRWYAGPGSPPPRRRHHLLIRRHLKTGGGLSLLFGARRPAVDEDRADQAAGLRCRSKKISNSARTASGRPAPGPARHRDRPPRRSGHGRRAIAPSPPPSCVTAPTPRHAPVRLAQPPPAQLGMILLTIP